MKFKLRPRSPILKNKHIQFGRGVWISAFLVVLGISVSTCGQNYNSNSGDGSNSGDLGIDCTSASGARLCAAYLAIQSNHCFECHQTWSAYKTDAAWTASGRVTAGNPNGSTLVMQLQNAGGIMPKNYGPMTDTEFTAIKTWIQNL